MEYDVILTREGRKWTAEVPALPGCITWGATREEVLVLVEEAAEGWLASRKGLRRRTAFPKQTVELAKVRVG
jgi:predicted RNase H-like HicB family nuclease